MTKQHSFDRRNVLKSIAGAATGAVGVGLAGTAGARSSIAPGERGILELRKVQRVYEAAGRPAVRRREEFFGAVGSHDLTSYTFETALGTLRYIEFRSYEVAQFMFGDDLRRSELPRQYALAAEVEDACVMSDFEGGINYLRSATAEEERGLQQATGKRADETTMFYSSRLEGYGVVTRDEDHPENFVVDPTDGVGTTASRTLADGSVRTVTPMEECNISACAACGVFSMAVVGCLVACASAGVGNIAAAVGCIACLVAAGVGVGYNCSECLDTCE